MDLDEFRMILSKSRADVWMIIDAAISVASSDYGDELKDRRDGIIKRLYATNSPICRNCDVNDRELNGVVTAKSSSIPRDNNDEDEEEADPYGGLFDDDDEETKILRIKDELEDPHQSEDSVVGLLQTLADMDITFKGLKETDIGRHVNRLRKHPSNDVRILVKQLVRKWKDLVDDWVSRNPPEFASSSTVLTDGDSPQQNTRRSFQNDHHQLPDFGYSPNPHNGSSGSERNNSEPEQKPKSVPRRENPIKPAYSFPGSASAPPPPNRPHKESTIDPEKLASARRRLQENYKEVQNAKKQRTIQVMDIHEIPKPKNGFISKNKGGFQGRHNR
ncbi:hypothetical protein LguiA_013497 [Lonicera macranthoides]